MVAAVVVLVAVVVVDVVLDVVVSAVVVKAVAALGVSGCVALKVPLVVPRMAHPLLPLPECMPTVVEQSQGWVYYGGCVEKRLRPGFDAVVFTTAVEAVTPVIAKVIDTCGAGEKGREERWVSRVERRGEGMHCQVVLEGSVQVITKERVVLLRHSRLEGWNGHATASAVHVKVKRSMPCIYLKAVRGIVGRSRAWNRWPLTAWVLLVARISNTAHIPSTV